MAKAIPVLLKTPTGFREMAGSSDGRLLFDADVQVNVGDVTIGVVEQGVGDPLSPWYVQLAGMINEGDDL